MPVTTITRLPLAVDLKLTYEALQRRFSCPSKRPSWKTLSDEIMDRFGLPEGFTFGLSYVDEDDEVIVLSSDKELEHVWPVIVEDDAQDLDALPPLRFSIVQLPGAARTPSQSATPLGEETLETEDANGIRTTVTVISEDEDIVDVHLVSDDENNNASAHENESKVPISRTLREDIRSFVDTVKCTVHENELIRQSFDNVLAHLRQPHDHSMPQVGEDGDHNGNIAAIIAEESGNVDAVTAGIISALLASALRMPPPPHFPPRHGPSPRHRHGHCPQYFSAGPLHRPSFGDRNAFNGYRRHGVPPPSPPHPDIASQTAFLGREGKKVGHGPFPHFDSRGRFPPADTDRSDLSGHHRHHHHHRHRPHHHVGAHGPGLGPHAFSTGMFDHGGHEIRRRPYDVPAPGHHPRMHHGHAFHRMKHDWQSYPFRPRGRPPYTSGRYTSLKEDDCNPIFFHGNGDFGHYRHGHGRDGRGQHQYFGRHTHFLDEMRDDGSDEAFDEINGEFEAMNVNTEEVQVESDESISTLLSSDEDDIESIRYGRGQHNFKERPDGAHSAPTGPHRTRHDHCHGMEEKHRRHASRRGSRGPPHHGRRSPA